MGQMNISVTEHLARFVRERVKSGRYNNASEVVRDALRRMEEEEQRTLRMASPAAEDVIGDLSAIEANAIRSRVLGAIDEIERGEYSDYESRENLSNIFADVKSRGRKALQSSAKRS